MTCNHSLVTLRNIIHLMLLHIITEAASKNYYNLCNDIDRLDLFFYSYEMGSCECIVKYVFLQSVMYEGYFDSTIIYRHPINGSSCKDGHHVSRATHK